jgi:hypothetical protein
MLLFYNGYVGNNLFIRDYDLVDAFAVVRTLKLVYLLLSVSIINKIYYID